MAEFILEPEPDTVRFGMFDAAFDPVLTIDSGDSVRLRAVSGGPEVMPPPGSGFAIPESLAAIHAAGLERMGPHILTGPVAIRGAEPGDMLEVRIDDVQLDCDWGYCAIKPLLGTLPEEFDEFFVSHIAIDRNARTAHLPWGQELALSPFFGTMGVAPPPEYGRLSSREPRKHGGNIDNRELGVGSTLFLPVWVPGANFSAGDGHGAQGDGEVCVNALETGLIGRFTFILHKRQGTTPLLAFPRAETPTHYITMGINSDLDRALEQALREMIAFICARSNLGREHAYQLCSLAADFRITQSVNGEKGVHGMLAREMLPV
ncbi:MAG: acetamidase/formamidase family protein [Novosphingobium sp.]